MKAAISSMIRRMVAMALLFAAPACGPFYVTQIACPPNHGRAIDCDPARDEGIAESMGADRFVRVDVGPPEASIGSWIFDPPDGGEPRGTILVLHGVADGPFWMRGKARTFAAHGYRAVLVGLRGYGESSGDFRSFGVIERRDLRQVLDRLECDGLVVGQVGVWGMSYGGATAIEFAGVDPRVRAVVSVGAFADMRGAIPGALKTFFPVFTWFKSDEEYRRIIDAVGEVGGFDPDEASPVRLIARTTAPVLLIHGDWDAIVSPEHARRLHEAAPGHSKLIEIPATGHFGTYLDFGGRVRDASLEWFDRWLAIDEADVAEIAEVATVANDAHEAADGQVTGAPDGGAP